MLTMNGPRGNGSLASTAFATEWAMEQTAGTARSSPGAPVVVVVGFDGSEPAQRAPPLSPGRGGPTPHPPPRNRRIRVAAPPRRRRFPLCGRPVGARGGSSTPPGGRGGGDRLRTPLGSWDTPREGTTTGQAV